MKQDPNISGQGVGPTLRFIFPKKLGKVRMNRSHLLALLASSGLLGAITACAADKTVPGSTLRQEKRVVRRALRATKKLKSFPVPRPDGSFPAISEAHYIAKSSKSAAILTKSLVGGICADDGSCAYGGPQPSNADSVGGVTVYSWDDLSYWEVWQLGQLTSQSAIATIDGTFVLNVASSDGTSRSFQSPSFSEFASEGDFTTADGLFFGNISLMNLSFSVTSISSGRTSSVQMNPDSSLHIQIVGRTTESPGDWHFVPPIRGSGGGLTNGQLDCLILYLALLLAAIVILELAFDVMVAVCALTGGIACGVAIMLFFVALQTILENMRSTLRASGC